MSRGAREGSHAGLYHAIVRGNNKTRLFHCKQDFQEFLKILNAYLQKHPVKIYHYCLMTNHIHLLIWSEELHSLSTYMHAVQRSYHHYYRKHYTWFGHLFQGRYRSLPIETESYLLDCGRYIERNPVRAKLVNDPKDWEYSSYNTYAYGIKNDTVTISPGYEALADGDNERQRLYRELVETTRPYEDVIDRELVGV